MGVITDMRQFKRALLARERLQMRVMTARWLELERSLKVEMELLARQMDARRRDGLAISQGALLRLDRYQSLLAQVDAEWASYRDYAQITIEGGQRTFVMQGVSDAVGAMEAVSPGITFGFNRLPVEAIENMVGLLGNGSPLQTLLLNNATEVSAIDSMTTALLNGTAMGRNPRKVARQMADGLAGGLNQALTISRTEQLRVYREAGRQQYQASGVVERYMRLATRDSRTCPACLALDGELIPLDQPMREHPQGRCAQVPVVAGFAPPVWKRGPDWFKEQSPMVQRRMLGEGRFKAWQAGEFDFADLATTRNDGEWGRSIQPTPLKDLV